MAKNNKRFIPQAANLSRPKQPELPDQATYVHKFREFVELPVDYEPATKAIVARHSNKMFVWCDVLEMSPCKAHPVGNLIAVPVESGHFKYPELMRKRSPL